VTAYAFNISYDEAFDIFKSHGRKNNDGVEEELAVKVWKKLAKKYGYTIKKIKVNKPTHKFIIHNPEGNFILSYWNHHSTLINGLWYDIDMSADYLSNGNLECVYKIEKIKIDNNETELLSI
jgi:hypothetical protein